MPALICIAVWLPRARLVLICTAGPLEPVYLSLTGSRVTHCTGLVWACIFLALPFEKRHLFLRIPPLVTRC